MSANPDRATSTPRLGFRSFLPALVIGLVIGLVLAVTLPPVSTTGASAGRWTAADVWTNGLVTVAMTPDRPAATVSGSAEGPAYGLYAGVSSIDEVTPNGLVVASANLDQATWTVANASGSGGLSLAYRSAATVASVAGAAALGVTTVFVNFTVAPAGTATGASSSQLDFGVVVLGWPWLQSSDRWAIDMPLWPQNTTVAYLAGAPGATNRMHCLSHDGNTPVASFSWEPNGSALAGDRSVEPLTAVTHLTGDASLTTVQVVFVGAHGGYAALSYDPQVSVPTPSLPTGLSSTEYAAALGVAIVATTLGVIGLRSAWNRRPTLEEAK